MEDVGPAEMGEVEYMMQKPGEEAEDAGKGREPTVQARTRETLLVKTFCLVKHILRINLQRGTMEEIAEKFMGGRMPESAAPMKKGGVITERAK